MIRGIVFDKDGTLFDFQATWASWAEALLAELFGSAAAARGLEIGFDTGARRFAPDSPVIAETTAHLADLLAARLPGWEPRALEAHMKLRAREAPLVEAVPLRSVIGGLRAQGLVLGLATNDDAASAREHLHRAGILEDFAFVAGYDSGHGGKPEAGQLRAFLAETGLAPGEVAMVGDSRHDLIAGRAAGMHTVGVLTGPAGAADLAPLADVVLADIGGLADWVKTA